MSHCENENRSDLQGNKKDIVIPEIENSSNFESLRSCPIRPAAMTSAIKMLAFARTHRHAAIMDELVSSPFTGKHLLFPCGL